MNLVALESVVTILDNLRIPVNSSERAVRVGDVPYYGATGQVGTIDKPIFNETLILLGEDGVPFFDKSKHKAYEISGPSWVNNHAHVLRAKTDKISHRYLLHYLNSFNYAGYVNGATRLKLTQGDMKRIPVPLPSLEKQVQIVARLDSAFAEINLLERNYECSLENAIQLQRSILNSSLTSVEGEFESLNPQQNRSRATRLLRLSDIFRVGSSKRVLKADWKNSGVPFFRGREISRLSKSGFAENDLYISEDHYIELSTKYGMPKAGDIMITAIGTIGNTYIVNEGDRFYYKDASVLWLQKKENVESRFVNYWLKSDFFFNQLDAGNGATVDTLTIEKLSSLELELPSLETQIEIVERIDGAFAELEALRTQIEQSKLFASELRQSLMSNAFSQEEAAA
jgi:restriction endonuclease S subunit